MRIADLPGQWVWLNAGTPVLYRSRDAGPAEIAQHQVVKVERIAPPEGTLPALAIWSDHEGEYGVEARRVTNQVMSLPPSGNSPVSTVVEAIAERLGHPHGR